MKIPHPLSQTTQSYHTFVCTHTHTHKLMALSFMDNPNITPHIPLELKSNESTHFERIHSSEHTHSNTRTNKNVHIHRIHLGYGEAQA